MTVMFTAMLPALYARLGVAATFAHGGAAATALRVVFDQPGGSGLGGMQLTLDPTVRLQTTDAPLGVARGDLFVVGTGPAATTWQAREAGLPLLDGAEIQVPLARA